MIDVKFINETGEVIDHATSDTILAAEIVRMGLKENDGIVLYHKPYTVLYRILNRHTLIFVIRPVDPSIWKDYLT